MCTRKIRYTIRGFFCDTPDNIRARNATFLQNYTFCNYTMRHARSHRCNLSQTTRKDSLWNAIKLRWNRGNVRIEHVKLRYKKTGSSCGISHDQPHNLIRHFRSGVITFVWTIISGVKYHDRARTESVSVLSVNKLLMSVIY